VDTIGVLGTEIPINYRCIRNLLFGVLGTEVHFKAFVYGPLRNRNARARF